MEVSDESADERMQTPEHTTDGTEGAAPEVVAVSYGLALLAWLAMVFHDPVGHALGLHGLSHGHVAPGVFESAALAAGPVGVGYYLAMWGAMMVAMMYPSSAVTFQEYADRRSDSGGRDTVRFVGAYTLLWVVVGLVPLLVVWVVPLTSLAATWGSLYLGLSLLVVGGFQLSSFKRRALRRCRSQSDPPVVDFGGESAARSGWAFGLHDVASCGVLMGFMVVVGSLNLAWMALITGVLLLERVTARGEQWARRVGVLATVVGIALVVLWFL